MKGGRVCVAGVWGVRVSVSSFLCIEPKAKVERSHLSGFEFLSLNGRVW